MADLLDSHVTGQDLASPSSPLLQDRFIMFDLLESQRLFGLTRPFLQAADPVAV
jgi:hypothetical protein